MPLPCRSRRAVVVVVGLYVVVVSYVVVGLYVVTKCRQSQSRMSQGRVVKSCRMSYPKRWGLSRPHLFCIRSGEGALIPPAVVQIRQSVVSCSLPRHQSNYSQSHRPTDDSPEKPKPRMSLNNSVGIAGGFFHFPA